MSVCFGVSTRAKVVLAGCFLCLIAVGVAFAVPFLINLLHHQRLKSNIESLGFQCFYSDGRWIVVGQGSVNGAHLEKLAAIGSNDISELFLDDSEVSDDDLRVLHYFDKLRLLSLQETRVTDAGLVHLDAIESLEELGLARTRIDGSGLPPLGRLPNLRVLGLTETQLSDRTLANLTVFQHIERLYINGTNVTLEGLQALSEMKSLRVLGASIPSLAGKGDDIRRQLPQLRVVYGTD